MLARLWYVFAVPWALLMTIVVFAGSEDPDKSAWFIVGLGPLLVPIICRYAFRFVMNGRASRY